jgi:hypothetical protein
MRLPSVPAVIAPVATIIAPVLTPIPATPHTPGHYRRGTSYRRGSRHRSSSEHATPANSTSTKHLRLLHS